MITFMTFHLSMSKVTSLNIVQESCLCNGYFCMTKYYSFLSIFGYNRQVTFTVSTCAQHLDGLVVSKILVGFQRSYLETC